MIPFIPLRLYSEYSIENSIIRLNDAIQFAKQQHFAALSLSDNMNMFGMIKFYQLCRNAGIKPLFSVDVVLQDPMNPDNHSRLLLIAKDNQGYMQLCELLTQAYLAPDKHLDLPVLHWQWLSTLEKNHLICLSAAQQGIIGQFLIHGKYNEAREWAIRLADYFSDSFYLEIQRFFPLDTMPGTLSARMDELKYQAEISLDGSIKLAQELELPIVATHPIQFMVADDFVAHEVKVCITSGSILADERRVRQFHVSQYFLSQQEMQTLFEDLPAALSNSYQIAQRCNVQLTLGEHFLPDFPIPNKQSLNDYLISQANQGLQQRLVYLYPDAGERRERQAGYQQRLDFELNIIIQMGFAGYFLIVADFINWAKNNACPVGPGRGSGAGSLVAYSLKITDLDPLKYNLLFERFLNPERVSMPDFDIDFCQENRGRVIDYVRHKYGEAAVSQIVTFSTMSSKAVIRDVGRVLGVPFGICDKLAKLIPLETNRPVSLTQAMEQESDIKRLVKMEEADELMNLALKLEDLIRGSGMHAGGVLIAPHRLTDFCPVYKASGTGTVSVSMYDKDDVEQVGLVKFDFLGLRNLTIIQMTQDLVAKNRQQLIDVARIPLDDALSYKIFQEANTTAVFQFESSGMKRMLFEAKPSKFEEIIAFVALYRPGPMDLIPDFIHRIHGEAFEYLHPLLETILKPTYGIMVYQEQVMQAAQICAGYSLGAADLLRRAMGKKKVSEMLQQRAIFVAGANKKGIDANKANEIFDYMERFAGYGFNKSHAAAYALIAYQTAWLKAHYLVEFVCATMSSELHNTDQLKILHEDGVNNKIQFLAPSINDSFYQFVPEGLDKIRYALGAIKGVGEGAVEALVQEREQHGAFKDLFDFCIRLDKSVVNKRVLESLIRAGAFDGIEANRAMLLGNVALALDYANQLNANQFQNSLFAFDEEVIESISLQQINPWNAIQQLAEEKEAIGFYLSGHPFAPYKEELANIPHSCLDNLKLGDNQWVIGFITGMRSLITKTGKKIWIVELDDQTAKKEVVINDELIVSSNFLLKVDMPLLCQCKISRDDYSQVNAVRITVKEICDIFTIKTRYARALVLELNQTTDLTALVTILKRHLTDKPGLHLKINYQNEKINSSLLAAAKWKVAVNQAMLDDLTAFLGTEQVKIDW